MIIGWFGKFCRKFYMRYNDWTTQLTKPGVLITATISRYLCLNISKLRNDEMTSCYETRDRATCVHKSETLLHSCSSMDKAQYCVSSNLTHCDQDNLAAILQTTFSNSFLLYGNCIILFKLAVIRSKWVN